MLVVSGMKTLGTRRLEGTLINQFFNNKWHIMGFRKKRQYIIPVKGNSSLRGKVQN